MRIIQEIANQKTITTTQLCQRMEDIPRTTLYRHITILLEHNLLCVVSEKKIRGSLERTLALNLGELVKHNTTENASQNALGFLLEKYSRFHSYFSKENPKPGEDKIFLNNTVLMLDDKEFDQFLFQLRELLVNYSFKPAKGRKARDISILSSPTEEIER
jgi:DNA-binding transcriptional ArsR family regulator